MKKYKPKTWFIYTRLFMVFIIIFALSRTTNVLQSRVIKANNNNESKALVHTVIDENKEDIYYQENPVMVKYMSLPEKGFVVTNNNQKYDLTLDDYNLLVAVVSSESSKELNDILAVISVILNRSDLSGKSPVEVITANGQFAGYFDGYYLRYLNSDGSLTSNTYLVQEVVNDALNGIRNNQYYSFRSWNSYSYSENYISVNGNRFN